MRNSVRVKKRERDCRNIKKTWGGETICGEPRITKSQEAPFSRVDDERKEAKTEGQKDNADRKDRDNERRGWRGKKGDREKSSGYTESEEERRDEDGGEAPRWRYVAS